MLTWTAFYRDGSKLHQIDPVTGQETSSERIDRSRLAAIALYDDRGLLVLSQHYQPGWRAVFRRRTEICQQTGQRQVVYLLGWQQTVEGRNVQHISAVVQRPDGGTLVQNIGRWQEGHRWLYPIVPVPADSEPVGGDG